MLVDDTLTGSQKALHKKMFTVAELYKVFISQMAVPIEVSIYSEKNCSLLDIACKTLPDERCRAHMAVIGKISETLTLLTCFHISIHRFS